MDFTFPVTGITLEIKEITYVALATREAASQDRVGAAIVAEMNIGGDFKDAISQPGHWNIGMGGFGETLALS